MKRFDNVKFMAYSSPPSVVITKDMYHSVAFQPEP